MTKMELTKVESVKEYFDTLDKEINKHPIRNWCYRKFWQLVRLPREIKLGIKTFIQRGKRGYADSDTWDFHDYLTDVITGGLKQLRKYRHGTPAIINPKTGEYEYDEKRWKKILDKMIYTFETAKKIVNNYPENDWLYCPTNEWDKLKNMRGEFNNEGLMRVMTKKECLAYEEGWDLFKTYFFNLWD